MEKILSVRFVKHCLALAAAATLMWVLLCACPARAAIKTAPQERNGTAHQCAMEYKSADQKITRADL
ncbi:MAG: hypothetical protein LBL73_11095 [Synergistaceae bacterium]|nr:hypothetical protein [Synergistaceae bacterium]